MELNNGRTLTLYDLGRVPMGGRVGGFSKAVLDNKWGGIAVAGGSIRYRKRVTAFQKIEMKTRLLGWDERFFYIEQSMWVKGTCTSHVLLRTAVTGKGGAVPPTADVAGGAMGGLDPTSPPVLPDWAHAWIAADAQRPPGRPRCNPCPPAPQSPPVISGKTGGGSRHGRDIRKETHLGGLVLL